MKIFSRFLIIFTALSFAGAQAVPGDKKAETSQKSQQDSNTKKIAKGIVRFPFIIGKNLTGLTTILGVGVTGTLAYLWLVKGVNAGGMNMTKLNIHQLYLEHLDNPGPREVVEWMQIQLYKNIDFATLSSGAATIVSGLGYVIFKSFTDALA